MLVIRARRGIPKSFIVEVNMSGKFRFKPPGEKSGGRQITAGFAVVRRALELTEVDFGITEGPHERAPEAKLVAEGKTRP